MVGLFESDCIVVKSAKQQKNFSKSGDSERASRKLMEEVIYYTILSTEVQKSYKEKRRMVLAVKKVKSKIGIDNFIKEGKNVTLNGMDFSCEKCINKISIRNT